MPSKNVLLIYNHSFYDDRHFDVIYFCLLNIIHPIFDFCNGDIQFLQFMLCSNNFLCHTFVLNKLRRI